MNLATSTLEIYKIIATCKMDIVFNVANSVWQNAIDNKENPDQHSDQNQDQDEKDYNDDPNQEIPPSRYKHRRPMNSDGNSGDYQIVNIDRHQRRHHRRTQNIITKFIGEHKNDNMAYYIILGLGGLVILKILLERKNE